MLVMLKWDLDMAHDEIAQLLEDSFMIIALLTGRNHGKGIWIHRLCSEVTMMKTDDSQENQRNISKNTTSTRKNMNNTSIKEYILVWKAFLQDNDPGKTKRLNDLWDDLTQDERNELKNQTNK